MRRPERRRQAGFTLIELMVALLVSSLLVIMILSIFARVSFAYREQQQIMALTQGLSAARLALENDAQQAGQQMAQGFKLAADWSVGAQHRRPPVRVVNSSTGPDEVGFYYADASAAALVTAVVAPLAQPGAVTLTVDDASGFAADEVVVLTTAETTTPSPLAPGVEANVATFDACVVQIASVAGNDVTFATVAPWGMADNAHCNITGNATMMYRFVGRYWRINVAEPELAPLQVEPLGNLVTASFQDMAYGFSDLQVATYFHEPADPVDTSGDDLVDTLDPDDDPTRDWESSGRQDVLTGSVLHADGTYVADPTRVFRTPLVMTMSLVARTNASVEGVFTAQTPTLTDAANPDNNAIGDRGSEPLPSATDPLLSGRRIYRYLTFQVDLRNLGVGR